ncbi:hypothetical protein DPM33_15145 [Mesorhizobium hawassense]|uniref:Uncharacterized protein n=1 Tax=Mesorhizobium hawassense TaxID=1209954 RepID=A0A330HRE9_9HYPH|nr:hypothetical protein [Mesorhizobium hawassense]RAZ90162.1 hypothetical protein DPM33_15145 [Mesorhizobium hawassense]
MSGILSALSPDSCIVLTDGSIYDRDGKLLAIKRKVAASNRVPLAVAARGNFVLGEFVSAMIIEAAEDVGFDRMLADLESELLPHLPTDRDLEILVAGVSEAAGPMHRVFGKKRTDREPLALVDPGPMHWGFGSDGRAVSLDDFGVPPPNGEPLEVWFARYGLPIFEFFRRIPVPIDPEDPNTDRQHLIGGVLDMTIVGREGASITRLHRWPDQVGERITIPDIGRHERRVPVRQAA